MEYEKVAEQFGDWREKFRPFIESSHFDDIFKFLKDQSRDNRTICPEHHNVFRTFKETPYKDLKCIFILQDPYPWIKNGRYVADGIPMSCSNTGILQPSLSLFYEGMEDDLKIKIKKEPDLSYLSKEGVLLLNSSLTVELNKPSSHKGVWDKFINFLVEDVINFYNTGLCYVAFGKQAIPITKRVIPFLHWGFEVEHPAAAAHSERKWNHQNIFSKINKVLKENNNQQIKWGYGQSEEISPEKEREPTSGIRGKTLKD